MANLNEAFKLQHQVNITEYSEPKNNQELNAYFDRVKVSNSKYDNMPKRCNKNPTWGYECNVCHKTVGEHMKIQKRNVHDFERGVFRKLTDVEVGII